MEFALCYWFWCRRGRNSPTGIFARPPGQRPYSFPAGFGTSDRRRSPQKAVRSVPAEIQSRFRARNPRGLIFWRFVRKRHPDEWPDCKADRRKNVLCQGLRAASTIFGICPKAAGRSAVIFSVDGLYTRCAAPPEAAWWPVTCVPIL